MFGHGRYLEMRDKAATLPSISVSKEEFIRLFMEQGKTREFAERQAMFAKALGSHVMIGDQMVEIE